MARYGIHLIRQVRIEQVLIASMGLGLALCPALLARVLAQPIPPARLDVAYTADGMANLRGGLERGAVFLDNLDLTLALDLESLIGWPRTSLFVYGLGNQGGSPSALAGDVQGVNNIEAPAAWRIYEAFVQHRLLNDRLSVLAGLYDVNTEFDVMESALLFVNSSFGIGAEFAASRPQGPSIFPFTSLGLRIRAFPTDRWYVQAAALDGVPGLPGDPHAGPFHFEANDGLLLVAETGVTLDRQVPTQTAAQEAQRRRISRVATIPYRLKIGLGGWYYTARFQRIDAATVEQRGNGGLYLLSQWRFFREPEDPAQGLRGFLRLGLADHRVNRLAGYTGGGVVYTGLLPHRPDDRLGLGVAIAHNGAPYERAQRRTGSPATSTETAVEVTYQAPLTAWLLIQGDVQVVANPDTNPSRRHALVVGLRLQVAYGVAF